MKHQRQLLLAAGLILLSPLFAAAQAVTVQAHPQKPTQLEKPGDPYLPNAYSNKKTSPAHKTSGAVQPNTSIFTVQVNVDSNQQNILGDAANEPNIAVNPENENEVVIGWRQFDNVNSNFRQAGWSYTSDGGQTWTFPGKIEPGVFRSDPVLDYDSAGNFYYNSLTLDDFGNYLCKVFKSTDGGATWNQGIDAHGGDKQWMTIDRTAGKGSGNIYAFWTYSFSSCLPGFFTRSEDEDSSFNSCSIVNGYPFWGTMAVGNNGELYVGGFDTLGNIIVAKSLNAQASDSVPVWIPPVPIDMDGFIGFSATVNPDGLMGQISIDVDRSNGQGRGNVYVAGSLARLSSNDPGDVMFARSSDGGTTWSPPVRINDDSSVTNTQWFGTMSVAPNGRIDVIWLDTRDVPFTDESALYYSYSIDEGRTWSANEKLSDTFNPHIGYPNQDKMGDYFDMVSDNTGAHLAWANTLNGEEDVYYSRIIPNALTAVNQNPDLSFSVFPNPVNGILVCTIPSFNDINSEGQIEIFNELGKRIYSQSILKVKNEINISSQPAGVYFLRIVGQNGNSAMKKIIKN